MRSNNPVFSRSANFAGAPAVGQGAWRDTRTDDLERLYEAPPATPGAMGRMTVEDVVNKTALLFAILLATAALSWFVLTPAFPFAPFVAVIAGLVLGLVISFKQSTSPALIMTYAAVEGVFVGGISLFFETAYSGVVPQAVLGTLAAFTVMLIAYRSGKLRATPRFTKGLLVAGGAYLLIALASFVSSFFGVGGGFGFYGVGGFGILLCVAGVALASLFLILDFDFVERGVQAGLPDRYSWLAGFGLMVTLVWLYIELLRLLSILRGDD